MSLSRTSSVRDLKSRSTTRSTKSRCAIGTRPTSTASPSCSPAQQTTRASGMPQLPTCTSCRGRCGRGGVPAPDRPSCRYFRQAGYGDRGEPRRPQHAPVHRTPNCLTSVAATDKPPKVRDELTGREFDWGWDNYVSLAPWGRRGAVPTVVEDRFLVRPTL